VTSIAAAAGTAAALSAAAPPVLLGDHWSGGGTTTQWCWASSSTADCWCLTGFTALLKAAYTKHITQTVNAGQHEAHWLYYMATGFTKG
jgi:hypothetical protein